MSTKVTIDYKKLKEAAEKTGESPQGAESVDAHLAKHDADIAKTIKELDRVNQLMFFVVIVLLVMVAGLVIAYISENTMAIQQLREDRYNYLNEKIDKLIPVSSESGKIKGE